MFGYLTKFFISNSISPKGGHLGFKIQICCISIKFNELYFNYIQTDIENRQSQYEYILLKTFKVFRDLLLFWYIKCTRI